MIRNRFTALALVAMTATGLTAATAQTAVAADLKLAAVAPPNTPWGQWMAGVGARVEELSGGDVTLDIHYSGELGDEQTMARQAARGRLDVAVFSNNAASLLVPEMQLLQLPFLWDSDAQMDCVYDTKINGLIEEMMMAKGLVPLAYVEVGPYVIFTKDPVKMPADMAGEKFRSAPTQSNVDFYATHGINGVPLGVADTAPAIKTGGVIGAEYTPLFGVAIGTHKLAPNILASYHAHTGGTLSVSKKVWDGLTAEQQSALREGASSFAELRAGVRGAHNFMLSKAVEEGATLTELTDEERQAWAATAAEVQSNMLSSIGGRADEFWTAIQDGKSSCDG